MHSAKTAIICAAGLSVSAASFLGTVWLVPMASWTLIAESLSFCGTARVAARSTLIFLAPTLVAVAFAGAHICREYERSHSIAHSLARLATTITVTCVLVAFVLFPLMTKF
jgi:hypothetical protein